MSNQVEGHPVDRAQQWRMVDKLTPRLRLLIAAAPYDFDVANLYRDFTLYGEAEAARRFAAHALTTRDVAIARTWGPEHPMIGSRRPERRAGRRA